MISNIRDCYILHILLQHHKVITIYDRQEEFWHLMFSQTGIALFHRTKYLVAKKTTYKRDYLFHRSE